jgi:hypothetical protein
MRRSPKFPMESDLMQNAERGGLELGHQNILALPVDASWL